MEHVVLVIHLLLALGIIGLVLIQKSEGGGLGLGESGGLGNIATARGTGNFLTRMTAIFATCFFITSLTLAVLAGGGSSSESLSEQLEQPAQVDVAPIVDPVKEPEVPISTE
ncbi:MAG: preprotein translocase subunit SecG [Micavibrio sp.]|nr:preprotein translocase subunit SecG [Micavibrio sp.]|tara:strand:- start:302 stop:637 length:336 start_codon:yes stop_codon:yes gene_type:complete